jgi:hypothetical protein
MPIPPAIREVFGHFQNLNLLALLHDLRRRETIRQAWTSGGWLCPVAHGLAGGCQVRELSALGQADDLGDGCAYAARQLGAKPQAVLRFVRSWDEQVLDNDRLLGQLEELWEERVADAEAVQEMLLRPCHDAELSWAEKLGLSADRDERVHQPAFDRPFPPC